MHRPRRIFALALPFLLVACADGVPRVEEDAAEATPEVVDGVIAISADQMGRIGLGFEPAEAAEAIPIATLPATVAPPPNARVAVAATIPGVVIRTLVVEGEGVRAGQPLAVIASREMYTLGAAIERANARVAAARASDRRLGQLAREGVIAGGRADEARATLREAEAELAEQRRIVGLVNGSPAQGTYTLTAPIAGTVTSATIQAGSPVDGATAAYVIDAVSRYELTAQLPERLVGTVRPGMTVRLGDDIRGEVTSVGSVVDPATRSATLRARIPAAPGVVSGGATSATLLAPAEPGSVIVPAGALVDIAGRAAVFVRVDRGIAVRPVEAGESADGRAVIRKGLAAGERVAVTGTSELKSIAAED